MFIKLVIRLKYYRRRILGLIIMIIIITTCGIGLHKNSDIKLYDINNKLNNILNNKFTWINQNKLKEILDQVIQLNYVTNYAEQLPSIFNESKHNNIYNKITKLDYDSKVSNYVSLKESNNSLKEISVEVDGSYRGHTLPNDSHGNDSTSINICKIETLPVYLKKRLTRLQSACQSLKTSLPSRWSSYGEASRPMINKLRWDRIHQLAYCHVPKVASTTWSWNLLRGIGMNDSVILAHDNVHILLHDKLPPPTMEQFTNNNMDSSVKFVVSRHPFHRLVSAYKNKIADINNRRAQYRALQKIILDKYRPDWDKDNCYITPTFKEFIDYVIDDLESWINLQDNEFNYNIQWPDLHWMPITYICSPCHVNYDVVSKLETMSEDVTFLATVCGMESKFTSDIKLNFSNDTNSIVTQINKIENGSHIKESNSKGITRFKKSPKSKKETSKFDLKNIYFRQLTNKQLFKLNDLYKFDFKIFGYDY